MEAFVIRLYMDEQEAVTLVETHEGRLINAVMALKSVAQDL